MKIRISDKIMQACFDFAALIAGLAIFHFLGLRQSSTIVDAQLIGAIAVASTLFLLLASREVISMFIKNKK